MRTHLGGERNPRRISRALSAAGKNLERGHADGSLIQKDLAVGAKEEVPGSPGLFWIPGDTGPLDGPKNARHRAKEK